MGIVLDYLLSDYGYYCTIRTYTFYILFLVEHSYNNNYHQIYWY